MEKKTITMYDLLEIKKKMDAKAIPKCDYSKEVLIIMYKLRYKKSIAMVARLKK